MDIKKEVLAELDSRIHRLEEHREDEKPNDGNQYAEMNHAISRVIGVALEKELEDLRSFVREL